MYCQTPDKIFRLGVDFVLPLSQEEDQQEHEEEQQEPLTKIYEKGVYLTRRLLMGFWLLTQNFSF